MLNFKKTGLLLFFIFLFGLAGVVYGVDPAAFTISKSSNPATGGHVIKGNTITYYLTYNVTGTAANLTIWDTITSHLSYLTAAPVPTMVSDRTRFWALDSVSNAGGNITITAQVVDFLGTIYNFGDASYAVASAAKESGADILYLDTSTVTQTVTQTITQTVTQTVTETITETVTPTITKTITQTVTQTTTQTATETITQTTTPTETGTKTITRTITPTFTISQTVTPTATKTFTVTRTFTATISPTLTRTPTGTVTPNNRGAVYFQATPSMGKIKLVGATGFGATKFIKYFIVDSFSTSTTVSYINLFDNNLLLKQIVFISGSKTPQIVPLFGTRADSFSVDWGINTGTSTTVIQ